jgi:hypothetical protein
VVVLLKTLSHHGELSLDRHAERPCFALEPYHLAVAASVASVAASAAVVVVVVVVVVFVVVVVVVVVGVVAV